MSSTRELLNMITALRQRLEQAQDLAEDASSVAAVLDRQQADPVHSLRSKIAEGARQQQQLDLSFRRAGRVGYHTDEGELPGHLTKRALELLQQTRALLAQLKRHAADPHFQFEETNPTQVYYQDTVLLADLLLRSIQTLPEETGLQLRYCAGIDVLLASLQQRVQTLTMIMADHQQQDRRYRELASLLRLLSEGKLEDCNSLFALAEAIVQETQDHCWLRFPSLSAADPLRWITSHSLTVARVIAQVGKNDPHWRQSLLQPIVAALVHDVGMLTVPADILARPHPLCDEEAVLIEKHCRTGAHMVSQLRDVQPWLIEATRCHHERLDGTGYPNGLIEPQIPPLVRLLSTCDVYVALCSERPHRAALETGRAQTELVQLAQRGILDAACVDKIGILGPYPPGTAVELTNQVRGIVLASRPGQEATSHTGRPLLALISDSRGTIHPFPRYLDLNQCDGLAIARCLTAAERKAICAASYPQWA